MTLINEDQVELLGIDFFKEIGYRYKNGYEISPDGKSPERDDFKKVIFEKILYSSLKIINPEIPNQNIENAITKITNPNIPGLFNCNREIHSWLTKGIKITYMKDDQEIGHQLKLIDFDNLENNDFLVVNQFEVKGDKRFRRPDVVVFIK